MDADRMGPRILITIGICGVALMGFFVGLSHTFAFMLFFLALMGFLGGGYHPSSPPLISALVEPKCQGQALGLHVIGGGASYFLAPLIAAAIAVRIADGAGLLSAWRSRRFFSGSTFLHDPGEPRLRPRREWRRKPPLDPASGGANLPVIWPYLYF